MAATCRRCCDMRRGFVHDWAGDSRARQIDLGWWANMLLPSLSETISHFGAPLHLLPCK